MRRIAACLALIGVAQAQPALAAACWKRASTEAAQVKQFDIMLMVSTLRCHGQGIDLSADYNRFVITKRAILRAVGGEMVKQLGASMPARAAQTAYDRIGTVMANKYGNGVEGLGCEGIRGLIALANDAPATRSGLVTLAQQAGVVPQLPQPSCDPVVAVRRVAFDVPAGQGMMPGPQMAVAQFGPQHAGGAMPALAGDSGALPDPTEIPLQIWAR